MSKRKNKKQKVLSFYEAYKKLRKIWGFSPTSKVLDKSEKKYSRTKRKRIFKKEIKEEIN